MDATQMISDSVWESDEEENEEHNENKREQPLAKLCILKNEHIPETELPLFLGDNVLGRDPNICTLPLPASSVSKKHATICISVYHRRGCHSEVDLEALVWDLGSMNGTRKGRLKLTPHVRYALSEGDSLVVADIPCQYVSCRLDSISSQRDMRTPMSRSSGVKASLPDAPGENGGDTSTGGEKSVNRATKARVSLKKTPVRASCLSFEQTPTQPKGSLVPESDSDSDSERGGDRRRKALVSDSDSHKSSPTCSTFLSPTNKIVPESEDESPITPSSSAKNRPYRHVSFSMEETDVDAGRQQKKKVLAIVDDSEEEAGREEERAAQGGAKSKESGQHVPVKEESSVSLTREDELPVSTPALLTDVIPAFNMDSDTDVEGEEEGVASAGPVTLNTNQQVDQPPNTVHVHIDSDTDIDEDEDVLGNAPNTLPSSDKNAKPPHVISVIQPEGITMDSDTDVDDDDAVSDAATKAKPTSFQNVHTADSASSAQPKDFHLDSDTDVDEEEKEGECGTKNKSSKIDETPNTSDLNLTVPESTPAAPHSLHLDSDTDDEAVPAVSEPSVVSCTTTDAGADLDILSDSDTDVEVDSPLVVPVVPALSVLPGTNSESDADTDVDESSIPPAGEGVNPANVRVDSDTDVEDKEADDGEAGEEQIPCLHRKNTPGLLVPLPQSCSTPAQSSEVEDMETQAFISPSSGAFKCAVPPAVSLVALSSCSDSQEDEDFAVAETQSFILQTRARQNITDPTQAIVLESSRDKKHDQSSGGESFQLGLSDSSHLQCQDQALAMESTQAFVSAEVGVNLENTQTYAAISDANLEATQAYGKDEEPARCSVVCEKEGQEDLALQATQAYISEPYSDLEDDTDEDKRRKTATTDNQPPDFATSSFLASAATQPMSSFVGEESLATDRTKKETEETTEQGMAAHPQERHVRAAQSIAETQPMPTSDTEESDDEDSFPGPRRTAKRLQLEEEQTQPLTCPVLSLVETQAMCAGVDGQPVALCEDNESGGPDSMPGPRKRKAKRLHLEEEETPQLTNSNFSAAETQPMVPCEDEDDDEDSVPGPRRRKPKPLQLEEEQTQPLTSSEPSAAETQPMATCEDDDDEEEDSVPGPRRRKAKPLQLEEEQTQSCTGSEVSAIETQPLGAHEGEQSDEEDFFPCARKRKAKPLQLEEGQSQPFTCSDTSAVEKTQPLVTGDEDSRPGPRKRKAKQLEEEGRQPLTNTEVSAVETQPLTTQTGPQPQKGESRRSEAGTSVRNLRGTRARLREQAECSVPPNRQTRDKNKTLPSIRGRRGKAKPDNDNDEKDEKQAKCARGKKNMKQQKDDSQDEEEHESLEIANKSLIKEREEKDAAKLRQQERERTEKERREIVEREEEIKRQNRREEEEKLAKERKIKEEQERLQAENAERIRLELERVEREHKEKEEKKRLERERKEQEEQEMAERELQERLEKERKNQELQAKLEREAKEQEEREKIKREKEAKGKQLKEPRENKEEDKLKVPARGRRAARRTTAFQCTTQLEQDSTTSANDDFPARRTRSRSNSSNSVSSERSASSVNTQESNGRGRGRGAKRTTEPPQTNVVRSSRRCTMTTAEPMEQDSNDICPQGLHSRSNLSNSLNSEMSSCSLNSQNRGRGGTQRGRGRKTEPYPDSILPVVSQSDQNSAPKPTARGRKSRKAEESSSDVFHEDDKEKADSQQARTTRGRRQAIANSSESAAPEDEGQSKQEEERANEESLLPKKNVRGRGQKVKSGTVEGPVAPTVNDSDESKGKRKGRNSVLEAKIGVDCSHSSATSKGKRNAVKSEAAEEEVNDETKDEIPATVQVKRRGRTSSTQVNKTAKEGFPEVEVKESEKMDVETVERRARSRSSVVPKKKEERPEESESVTSKNQDASVEASEQPQTPTSNVSRKRQAPADSSPVAKTPRSSSASPAARGRLRVASQAYKVLFTGVVDEAGEKVLARLGGCMAKGVADMNCLVTDKVRRTVKFLCAVAKGIPVVTTDWLLKSGKSGSFLSPHAFIVKDPEQEKKFSFCLQESIRTASSQPLLQGYEIHITKTVKPEPVQMKDIISSSGATFLPKMPSSHKPQTVVISCEEDWLLCGPAVSASLPIVTAEFILTGILQQKLDFQTHTLSPPTPRGKGRRKT